MWEFFHRLVTAIIPTKEASEPDITYTWRITVSFYIVALGAIQMIALLAMSGYLSFIGVFGFAAATDVVTLKQQSIDSRITQIENSIAADRTRQCYAMMEGNQAAMSYTYSKLQNSLNEYTNLMKMTPRIPDCRELIPSVQYDIRPPTPDRPAPTPILPPTR